MGELAEKVIPTQQMSHATLNTVLIKGDLASLTEADRFLYYNQLCETIGLNPLSRPFDYIVLNGKLSLYAKKDATDQIRKNMGISIVDINAKPCGDIYIVTVKGRSKDGREDVSTGVVSLIDKYQKKLTGEALANAFMKAETKAKRRVTLSLGGLGMVDESEVDSIPGALIEDERKEFFNLVNNISSSSNIEDLKASYHKAMEKFRLSPDKELAKKIIAAKDDRKRELEHEEARLSIVDADYSDKEINGDLDG